MHLTEALPLHPLPVSPIAFASSELARLSCHEIDAAEISRIPIMKKMTYQMSLRQPLCFILPAFPAKSPSPFKTSGTRPDLGEVLGLQRLNTFCKKISTHYPPGARMVICSDGRVFGEVVMVSDSEIDAYSKGIDEIIDEFHLHYLSIFSMDHLFPGSPGPELRTRLLAQYARSLEEIRHLVLTDENMRLLFNGVHRFLVEDQVNLSVHKHLSRNQLSKRIKANAYELLRRSDAWSNLLALRFPDSLRLSIHAYPIEHEKFGVRLANADEKWATPWHNVTVKLGDTYKLMHLVKAIEKQATKSLYRGKYVYFQA